MSSQSIVFGHNTRIHDNYDNFTEMSIRKYEQSDHILDRHRCTVNGWLVEAYNREAFLQICLWFKAFIGHAKAT